MVYSVCAYTRLQVLGGFVLVRRVEELHINFILGVEVTAVRCVLPPAMETNGNQNATAYGERECGVGADSIDSCLEDVYTDLSSIDMDVYTDLSSIDSSNEPMDSTLSSYMKLISPINIFSTVHDGFQLSL
jgi:hypothetical protein